MLKLTRVLGNVHAEATLQKRCDRLAALGKLEVLQLDSRETQKSRLRKTTDKGTEIGIVLERGILLEDGDILYLEEPDKGIVVEVMPEDVMAITLDIAGTRGELIANAVRLGHILGNQHWPIKVEGETVYVPVSITPEVMETVMKTYHVHGIHYEFKQAQTGGFPRVAGAASEEGTHSHD